MSVIVSFIVGVGVGLPAAYLIRWGIEKAEGALAR